MKEYTMENMVDLCIRFVNATTGSRTIYIEVTMEKKNFTMINKQIIFNSAKQIFIIT